MTHRLERALNRTSDDLRSTLFEDVGYRSLPLETVAARGLLQAS